MVTAELRIICKLIHPHHDSWSAHTRTVASFRRTTEQPLAQCICKALGRLLSNLRRVLGQVCAAQSSHYSLQSSLRNLLNIRACVRPCKPLLTWHLPALADHFPLRAVHITSRLDRSMCILR